MAIDSDLLCLCAGCVRPVEMMPGINQDLSSQPGRWVQLAAVGLLAHLSLPPQGVFREACVQAIVDFGFRAQRRLDRFEVLNTLRMLMQASRECDEDIKTSLLRQTNRSCDCAPTDRIRVHAPQDDERSLGSQVQLDEESPKHTVGIEATNEPEPPKNDKVPETEPILNVVVFCDAHMAIWVERVLEKTPELQNACVSIETLRIGKQDEQAKSPCVIA